MVAFTRRITKEIKCAECSAALSGALAYHSNSYSHGKEEEEEEEESLASHLRRCGKSMELNQGRLLHHHIISCSFETDLFLSNLVLQMYGKCRTLPDAYRVFSQMHLRDVFTWTFIISANGHTGHENDALLLFHRMHHEAISPNKFTFVEILGVSAMGVSAIEGKRAHSCIYGTLDIVTLNALVHFYGKSGDVKAAEQVFDAMEERDEYYAHLI